MSSTVSRAIKIALVKQDLTQKDLRIHLSYSKSYISEICSGKKELKPSKLESLAMDFFFMSLSELIELGE